MAHADADFKDWDNVDPGQLKKEINDAFNGTAAGTYYALLVKVENPITGYLVVTTPE